ncbi:MAG: S-layer homology domain-containing protein [bacterium]|nr:S-layer homology domain-containing protein [bacterium]
MKKCLLVLGLMTLTTLTANSASMETGNWYQYNGSSTLHSYSISFPTDWKVYEISKYNAGFAPKETNDEYFYSIREFEGISFDQAINATLDSSISLEKVEDEIFPTIKGDLIAKNATYYDGEKDSEFNVTYLRHGSLIVALTGNEDEYSEIAEAIKGSFKFTDDWHHYIDLKDNYSFIFPTKFEINTLSNGIELVDDTTIFQVLKYEDINIDKVAGHAEGANASLLSQEQIVFHGLKKAIKAEYKDSGKGKKFNRIFVEKNGDSFSLTDTNVESNYPHSDYYDQYIVEILESFEFYELEGDEAYSPFKNFPDLRDDHPNAEAVNSLFETKVIQGYPDGNFKPDGEINRAELTKMIVGSLTKPDPSIHSDCFPDVKKEWFAPYICYAKERGWVEGYPDGKFKPDDKVNRVEAMKIILEALFDGVMSKDKLLNNKVKDIDTDEWYGKYFVFADNKNLLDKQHIDDEYGGYYYYFPNDNITRKEVAETIYRAQQL